MAAKTASTIVKSGITAKAVRGLSTQPRTRKPRLSKLEAERLESFKTLMKKYAGKCSFPGFDK
jgi:hypothetical protein